MADTSSFCIHLKKRDECPNPACNPNAVTVQDETDALTKRSEKQLELLQIMHLFRITARSHHEMEWEDELRHALMQWAGYEQRPISEDEEEIS